MMNATPDSLYRSLEAVGVGDAALRDPQTAHLLVDAHHPLSRNEVPGVEVMVRRRLLSVAVKVRVLPGRRIANPVHLCFGLSRPVGTQRVHLEVDVGANSAVRLLAHCLFAQTRRASHVMHARIHVGRNAELSIEESHVHGWSGGSIVKPKAYVDLAPGARFFSDFSLLQGRVGVLQSDYRIDVADQAIVEIRARVHGRGNDQVELRDHIRLNGVGARGMVKTRVALEEQATAVVYGTTDGNNAGARGHMDCTEIVKDDARAESVPVVRVGHPKAQVTHEAAIGTVDQTQLEALMAHGLTPDEAVEMVISGILRPDAPAD
jgi:Fe-S cluster assembly scaffold protein SufB